MLLRLCVCVFVCACVRACIIHFLINTLYIFQSHTPPPICSHVPYMYMYGLVLCTCGLVFFYIQPGTQWPCVAMVACSYLPCVSRYMERRGIEVGQV